MRKLLIQPIHLAAAALLALSPGRAAAQTGFFVGVGGGVSRVSETEVDRSTIRPLLHLRAGYGIRPSVGVMVELTQAGIGAAQADSAVIDGTVVRGDRRLSTTVLLVSAQLGDPRSVYVRPGLGFGRHAFSGYAPAPGGGYVPDVSHEAGVAAGIAVGHEFAVPGFPVSVEATGLWSSGEDSSSSRVSFGLQLVHDIRF
jgi:hypothetical protein